MARLCFTILRPCGVTYLSWPARGCHLALAFEEPLGKLDHVDQLAEQLTKQLEAVSENFLYSEVTPN